MSLTELAGDYEAFLLDRGEVPWPDEEKRAEEFRALRFDPFEPGTGNVRHNYGNHFLRMRKRFAGAAMVKRLAKKGRNAGNAFWSCPHWPECEGTRPC